MGTIGNKKAQIKKKAATKNRAVSKKVLIIAAIALALLGVGYWWFFGGGMYMGVKQEMEAYLEKKYGEEFEVSRPKYLGGGVGVDGYYEAQAKPVNDERIQFRVGMNERSYSDEYVAEIWTIQANSELVSIVKRVYGAHAEPDIKAKIKLQKPLIYEATKQSPGYAIAKGYNEGFVYWLIISSKVDDFAQINEDARLFYRLSNELRKSGVYNIAIDYRAAGADGSRYTCGLLNKELTVQNEETITSCITKKEGTIK